MSINLMGRFDPVKLVVAGAGSMGRAWMQAIIDSECAELVGVADVVPGVAKAAIRELSRCDVSRVRVGADAVDLALATAAQAVVNVTIPEAHYPVALKAMRNGLPVLGEKPAASTLAQAVSLAAHSETTGQLFMVSQSRRYNPHVFTLKQQLGKQGGPAVVTCEFFKAPHFGGFREEMSYPLIVDMAIHQFDAVRYMLGVEPVSVRTESFNVPWSWYVGDANVVSHFIMSDGSRFTYSGSWCQPGAETSWNAAWRFGSESGTLLWDGESAPTGEDATGVVLDLPEADRDFAWEISGSLKDFCGAIQEGGLPGGSIRDNLYSLAMVEAAVESARTDNRVLVADLLEAARIEALSIELGKREREWLSSVRFT